MHEHLETGMGWTNYHSHTLYSDGKDTPERFAMEAERLGMPAFGFSCHAPLPYDTHWTMKAKNIPKYIDHIRKLQKQYAGKVQLYCGLEVDYIQKHHEWIMNVIRRSDLDYIIGSIHYLGNFEDGSPWNIDSTPGEFEEGFVKLCKTHAGKLISTFFSQTRNMISEMKPDVIGHFDKIKLHNINNTYFSEQDALYTDEVMQTLQMIKSAGCVVEVNTRGVYNHALKQLYPSPWILAEIKRLGIPVTISSDCHIHTEIIKAFPETAFVLKELGFSSVAILCNGTWQSVEFDGDGLHISQA